MEKNDDRILFKGMLDWLIFNKKMIAPRDAFRLAFMSICNGDPQIAGDLKEEYVKELSQNSTAFLYYEGYMTALCDEVAALGKKSLSSQGQATP